jgi:hypothetical protein
MDIHPGVTKSNEMINSLRDHEEKGEGDLTIIDSGVTVWRTASGRNFVIYKDNNDIVSRVSVDLRPISIHLVDITKLFGEPSNLKIDLIDNGYFLAALFYPEEGLVVKGMGKAMDVTSANNIGYDIQPNIGIVGIEFIQISDLTNMVNLLYGGEAIPEALSDIQDWKGYGVYHEK